MRKSSKRIDVSLLLFQFTAVILVFLLGGITALNNWQPFKSMANAFITTSVFIMEQTRKKPVLLKESVYEGQGVRYYDKFQSYNGLTALQGTMPGGTQIRLIDMGGHELHRWPISFYKIWPNPVHLDEKYWPKTEFNYHTQGLVVQSDGSIIINIGDKGTAKLDRCGEVIWTVDHMTHHSITPAAEGGYWIPSRRPVRDIPDHLIFPGITRDILNKVHVGTFHSYENTIILVNENGVVQKEFSLLQSLYDGGFESQIFDAMLIKPSDPTHINDIEIVTRKLSEKIPGISEGDLLVSIRQMHMLVVLDQTDGSIKWHFRGPWIRQHDPDIEQNGNITLFNNGHNQISFNRIPGSNIVELNTDTMNTRVVYPLEGQTGFYTDIMGGHELLPNGNMLIIESRAGRVFEINQQGEIVWDYVLPYDESHSSLIATAVRLDYKYFNVSDWGCQ